MSKTLILIVFTLMGTGGIAGELKSLDDSEAFTDKAEWVNENQSEGLNGSFNWIENLEDEDVKPHLGKILETCKPASLAAAGNYLQELMDQVTDSADEEDVKKAKQAVKDFKKILSGGKRKIVIQKCEYSHSFTDDVGNGVDESFTMFRNKTTGYDVVFRFTAI